MIKKLIPAGVINRVNLLINKGDKYKCSFCEYNAKRMLPIGEDLPVLIEKEVIGGGLRDGICVKCGSFDRERLIHVYLKYEFKLEEHKDIKILHIAPEKNLSNYILDLNLNYTCGDLFTEGYEYPSHVADMNVLSLPFDENHFDLVICNHVLEHIPNDTDAMKEIYRVLKSSGKAILQVPISNNTQETFEDFSIIDPNEMERAFGQFDHVRIYGQDYSDRLSSVGFSVDRVNISKKYQKVGLSLKEDIFITTK